MLRGYNFPTIMSPMLHDKSDMIVKDVVRKLHGFTPPKRMF